MKPVRNMSKKRTTATTSTSAFGQSATSGVVTRGNTTVKTYGRATRSTKKQGKANQSSDKNLKLPSQKVVTPTPPHFMEPIPPPPTLKRFDEESLVGGPVHTVPRPGIYVRPTEEQKFEIIEEGQEEEYEASTPIISGVRSLVPVPLPVVYLTKVDDQDKTRNEEKTNDLGSNDKPKVRTPPSKKGIVRRRSRKPVKDISSDIVRKAYELTSQNDFLLKAQREFVGLKNNSDSWRNIAMAIPSCWIFLEAFFESKHATKN